MKSHENEAHEDYSIFSQIASEVIIEKSMRKSIAAFDNVRKNASMVESIVEQQIDIVHSHKHACRYCFEANNRSDLYELVIKRNEIFYRPYDIVCIFFAETDPNGNFVKLRSYTDGSGEERYKGSVKRLKESIKAIEKMYPNVVKALSFEVSGRGGRQVIYHEDIFLLLLDYFEQKRLKFFLAPRGIEVEEERKAAILSYWENLKEQFLLRIENYMKANHGNDENTLSRDFVLLKKYLERGKELIEK